MEIWKNKYLQTDTLLILHMTDRCNNNCSFCMIGDLHSPFVFPTSKAKELIDTMSVGSKVDFFGGEPTLHPDFFELLNYVKKQQLDCSIATNARLFKDLKFTHKVAAIYDDIYIRTSLYGANAAVHDSTTRSRGSFDDFQAGLKNIIKCKLRCQVNIVITRLTIDYLLEMTNFIIQSGAWGIKFGLVKDVTKANPSSPLIRDIRPSLNTALHTAIEAGLKVTIEKAPLCLAPEWLHLFSSERDVGKWERVFDDEETCHKCLCRKWCDGLDPGYANLLGFKDLQRIRLIPRSCLFKDVSTPDNLSFMKLNILSLSEFIKMHERYENNLIEFIDYAQKCYARIMFVPDDYICSTKSNKT